METLEKLRSELIDRISAVKNKELLVALDHLISSYDAGDRPLKLTTEQQEILEMSESDIKNGRLISQEAMDKRNLEWLNYCFLGQSAGS